jgi:multiple sugar transport system substrate-binding protein
MNKRFFSVIRLVIISSFIFVACKPTSTTTKTPTKEISMTPSYTPTSPSTGRIKMRWFIGVGTGKFPDAVHQAEKFIEDFNNSQGKIELELEVNSISTHAAVDQILAEIEAGNPPDIITPADMGWSGEQLIGHILPLDDYLKGYDLSSIDPALLESWRVNGALMGLPTGSFSSVIFYNKELFDAAGLPYPPHMFGEPYADGEPWTVEKMESIAMQLTMDSHGRNAIDPNFDPNTVMQWGFHWQWDSTRSMAVIFGAGDVVDVNGDAVIPPQWREGFNWYYEGIWKKHFIPSLALANGPMMKGNPFYSGKVAMIHYFTSYSSRLVGVPGLISIPEWDIAAVPSYNGKVTTRLERDGILILDNTQHPAEAVEIAYSIATDPELLLAWEMLPAFKDLQSLFLKQLAAKHPGVDWQVMLDSMDYTDTTYDKVMPNYRKSYDRLLAFRDLLGNEENLTLEFEIDKLESDLQALFEEVR